MLIQLQGELESESKYQITLVDQQCLVCDKRSEPEFVSEFIGLIQSALLSLVSIMVNKYFKINYVNERSGNEIEMLDWMMK